MGSRNIVICETPLNETEYVANLGMEGKLPVCYYSDYENTEKEIEQLSDAVLVYCPPVKFGLVEETRMIDFCRRAEHSLLILVQDIDKFKLYNDSFYKRIKKSVYCEKYIDRTVYYGWKISNKGGGGSGR